MKCKVCGHRANSIKSMSAHYRKKHPNRMKARTHRSPKVKSARMDSSKLERLEKLLELLG